MSIQGLFARNLGIDLGSVSTRVYAKGRGIALQERSAITLDRDSRRTLAVGDEANAALGRSPGNVLAIRPVQEGVLVDAPAALAMLKGLLQKAKLYRSPFRPQVVIAVPSGASGTEKRALQEVVMQAGAREAFVVDAPLAAALGAGLPVQEPMGSMVVNIGGGRTEVAVTALGGMVAEGSIPLAGNHLDEAIAHYLKRQHSILVGETTSERLKVAVGKAGPNQLMEVCGRDMVTGLPRVLSVEAGELQQVMAGPLRTIANLVKGTLERIPPELLGDVMSGGIMLTGGGALLGTVGELLARETGLPVRVADDPLNCVVMGTAVVLENLNAMRRRGSLEPQPRRFITLAAPALEVIAHLGDD